MQEAVLVVGGTSGLGLELAHLFSEHSKVIVMGRHDPEVEDFTFIKLDLAQGPKLAAKIAEVVKTLPHIRTLVYAPGFFQEGRIDELDEAGIEAMIDVGGRALVYLARELLKKQKELNELITVTSTSQWTPRRKEPVYNFVKAAAGHFSNALAEDGRIERVLVAGPAGMDTPFWTDEQRHVMGKLLDPKWVAEQIFTARSGGYRYKFIKILREPARVEEVEEREA